MAGIFERIDAALENYLNRRGALEKYSYSQDIVNAILENAQTEETARAAAEETVAGIVGRSFAIAEVAGSGDFYFPPDTMVTIGRELILHGESIWQRQNGQLVWQQDYDIADGNRYSFKGKEVPSNTVFHCRYAIDRSSGRGISPLLAAKRTRSYLRQSERVLEQESRSPVGYVMPTPLEGTKLEEMRDYIKKLQGRLGLVETMTGGWGNNANAPRDDWAQHRYGMDPSPNAIAAYRDAHIKALAIMGVPVPVVEPSDSGAMREGWRILLHSLLHPLANLTEAAASNIGVEIRISFEKLMASDISGRARAFGSMLANGEGLEVDEAARIAGLRQADDGT